MAKFHVGLEVHTKNCVYAVQDEDGKLLGEGSVPTSPKGLLLLRRRFELPEGTPVGLETGTVAFHVARLLGRTERG